MKKIKFLLLAFFFCFLLTLPVSAGKYNLYMTEGDPGYVKYNGRLTYSSNDTNKNGQRWPDIMDYDRDGDIDLADWQTQAILVHNPDALETPKGAALVITAFITALVGAGGGAAVSVFTQTVGSAASGIDFHFEFAGEEEDSDETPSSEEAKTDTADSPPEPEDLGKYIRRDPDGDLYVKDPVTGKETLYIKQKDGRYRNTVSEQDYTVGEINDMLSHVEDNKGYYSDISKKQQEAVEYQHEHASDFSETSAKLAEQIRQQKEQEAREDAINKIGYEHGVYNGDEDAIRERLAQKQAVEVSINDAYHRSAARIDTAVKVAETTKKVADVAADVVATADQTGIFKDIYSATTAAAGNAGEVMAGNMTAAEAVAKTAVEASTEIIKNRASSTGAKFAANILGDSAQDATSAMLEGKDLGEVTNAAIAGAGRGFLDSTVDYAVATGNKVAASSDGTHLTDAGETFVSDLAKLALPKVEVPKKKDTVGEMNDTLSHAEENKGNYSDISEKQQEDVASQHKYASGLSETSIKLMEQERQQKEQDAREDAIYKIGYEHGIYNGDEDAIRERLKEKQAVAESINETYHRTAARIDTAVKVAEGTKKVADVAADVVGTVDKTGVFKDVYSATTAAAGNAGEVMAGNMTAAEAVAKTAVDASTEIIKNRAQSTKAKFAANILGDSAQDATSAMLEGKDLGKVTNAAIAGAGRGFLDSTVDAVISKGNKAVASSGRRSLSDAGETFVSDLAKSALPKIEPSKKKEE